MENESVVQYLNYAISGYKFTLTNHKYHPDYKLSPDEQTDVFITTSIATSSDYKNIVSKSVGMCNGLLYRQAAGDDGIYLLGAGLVSQTYSNPTFGILDFNKVGRVVTTPITRDMIIEFIPGTALQYEAYIRLPENLAGKSAMFSIGGCLYFMGSIVGRVSETIYKISINKLNIARKLYEGRQKGLDVASLELTTFEDSMDVITSELISDEFIISYLTHATSFIITTDYNSYTVEKHQLENPRYPGKYIVEHLPLLPIMSDTGFLANYHRKKADNKFIIHSDFRVSPNNLYDTTTWMTSERLSYTRRGDKPYHYPDVFELKITYQNQS